MGVGVVGEGRPSVPDLVAFVAFEPAAAQAVAAFEVADPALYTGAVALSEAAGAPGAWFLAAGDVHLVGQALERGVGLARHEHAVDRHLPQLDAQSLELLGGVGQQRVLGRVADTAGRWQDEPAGAGLGVGGDLDS